MSMTQLANVEAIIVTQLLGFKDLVVQQSCPK